MSWIYRMMRLYNLSGISNQVSAVVQIIKRGWHKSNRSDFSDRYADNWRSTTAKAHKATGNICCYCGRAVSQEVHHGYYRRLPIGSLLVCLLWFLLIPIALLLVTAGIPADGLLIKLLLCLTIVCAPVVLLLPKRAIKGREVIGWDVFPVCGSVNHPGTCHHRLHLKCNWITDSRNPKLGNRNKAIVIWRLRMIFLMLKLKS